LQLRKKKVRVGSTFADQDHRVCLRPEDGRIPGDKKVLNES
jgi:hypothetical protein